MSDPDDSRTEGSGTGARCELAGGPQAPGVAERGAGGEARACRLEVRSAAHAGLVGLPNAGKSTLLRALSRARPAVAPHAFTTRRPHLGMVLYDDYEQVAIADLPGLIPGSHKNYGLGIQFLQHVERCRGLIFLLDGTENALGQLETLKYELSQYSSSLTERPSIVVVNKIDLPEGRRSYEELKKEMEVVGISAKTGMNLIELLRLIRVMYDSNNDL